MLTEASSRGALTVALTSHPESPLAEVADVTLTSATSRTGFRADMLAARHSQLLVADLVYIAVAQRRLPETMEAFESRARAVVGHRPRTRPSADTQPRSIP
jgi:DNA-binding MurR/RpiR family transcriptional regulator